MDAEHGQPLEAVLPNPQQAAHDLAQQFQHQANLLAQHQPPPGHDPLPAPPQQPQLHPLQPAPAAQTHVPATASTSMSGKASRPPATWCPAKQSWADYKPSLLAYFLAEGIHKSHRGLKALQFLPNQTQQALFHKFPLLADADNPTLTWEQLDVFCGTQQVAYQETDLMIHDRISHTF